MVAAFGLKDRYDVDFLRRLFVDNGWRRELARIACVLGFEDSLRDVIEELIKSGNEVEAIYIAHEAGLLERFTPVPLLKSYIKSITNKTQVALRSEDIQTLLWKRQKTRSATPANPSSGVSRCAS